MKNTLLVLTGILLGLFIGIGMTFIFIGNLINHIDVDEINLNINETELTEGAIDYLEYKGYFQDFEEVAHYNDTCYDVGAKKEINCSVRVQKMTYKKYNDNLSDEEFAKIIENIK